MRRARYQHGTVELSPRSHGPAVWVYRWRETGPQGNSVRNSLIIGTTDVFKSKAQAMKAADELRIRANVGERESCGFSFSALIEKFIAEERLFEAKNRSRAIGVVEEDEEFDPEVLDPSTAYSYLSMLNVHIRPRWKDVAISDVKPALVQAWLRSLDLAPKSKGHIKAVMHRSLKKQCCGSCFRWTGIRWNWWS